MKLRTLIFWMHLPAGVLAGAIILIMSVTGVLLAYEKQITAWADGYSVSPPPGPTRLPPETLLSLSRAALPDATASGLTLRADPKAPA
ncbi:MAG TPA: PepSY domain-containing protein, partial [Vicinamibacteria bacterium]